MILAASIEIFQPKLIVDGNDKLSSRV